MGFFAPDPGQSGSYFGSADPSLLGDSNLLSSAPLGIPPPNFARGSSAAALVTRAISPYVNAYEDLAVAPMRAALTALANSPVTDPGLWMSLQGLGPPGALAAGVGGLAAKGLRALAVSRNPALLLSERADEVLDALKDPIAIKNRNVAVLDTDGPTIVGSGTKDIYPAQRAIFRPNETEARLPGKHAEVTVLQDAQNQGLTPSALGVSDTICPACQQAIESAGGRVNSPTTARFPDPEWLPWIPPYRWP